MVFFLKIFWCWIFKKKLFLQAKCKEQIFWCKIFTHKFFFDCRVETIAPFEIKRSVPYSFSLLYLFTWVWIQWYFLWPLSNCCWALLDGICISCEVPSIADTTLGISEQYPFFCDKTGMVGHWLLRLHTFYKSTNVVFKTLSTVGKLTPKHK